MHIESYDTEASAAFKTYTFVSSGLKGDFQAIVKYIKIPGLEVYNLEFGIENYDGTVNDLIVLNNGDTQKILKTIAETVVKFSKEYPMASIIIVGSTKSRTRLYKIMINKFFSEISENFTIFGETEGKKYEEFKPNSVYTSFLIERK